LDWPLGQVAARTAAGSGLTVPRTLARAAPVPGVAGSCRDWPSIRPGVSVFSCGGTEAFPVGLAEALYEPEPAGLAETGAEALNEPAGLPETGAEPAGLAESPLAGLVEVPYVPAGLPDTGAEAPYDPEPAGFPEAGAEAPYDPESAGFPETGAEALYDPESAGLPETGAEALYDPESAGFPETGAEALYELELAGFPETGADAL
jgi:hypothetical protein